MLMRELAMDECDVVAYLSRNGISYRREWGTGGAKKLGDLFAEQLSGLCTLSVHDGRLMRIMRMVSVECFSSDFREARDPEKIVMLRILHARCATGVLRVSLLRGALPSFDARIPRRLDSHKGMLEALGKSFGFEFCGRELRSIGYLGYKEHRLPSKTFPGLIDTMHCYQYRITSLPKRLFREEYAVAAQCGTTTFGWVLPGE